MPDATHRALKDLGTIAGSAAALQRSLQMVAGAIARSAVGSVGGNNIVAMASVMTAFATIAFILFRIAVRRSSRTLNRDGFKGTSE